MTAVLLAVARTIFICALFQPLFSSDALAETTGETDREIGRLSRSEQWLALLHYKAVWPSNRFQSRVTSRIFFVSNSGENNPDIELAESYKALKGGGDVAQDFVCRFPARAKWIAQHFPELRLPDEECVGLSKWKMEIGARKAVLVFASSTINSPPSMFGHPFLRFDGEFGDLQSFALSYAIPMVENDGLHYPIKAVFGGYKGSYSLAPYYLMLNAYRIKEGRDIWEYELSLSEAEVERLILHVWELRSGEFQYYFLDENCGSLLLDLLQIARPALKFGGQSRSIVIPKEVLREVVSYSGLVSSVRYLPSEKNRLKNEEQPIYLPHEGHSQNSLEISKGYFNDGSGSSSSLTEFEFRPGYHEIIDPSSGFQRGAAITYLTAKIRNSNDRTRLESATLIKIESLGATATQEPQLAWIGGVQFDRGRSFVSPMSAKLSAQPVVAAGVAKTVGNVNTYVVMEARAFIGPEINDLGFGPQVGVIYQGPNGISLDLRSTRRYFLQSNEAMSDLSMEIGLTISPNAIITSRSSAHQSTTEKQSHQFLIGVRAYF